MKLIQCKVIVKGGTGQETCANKISESVATIKINESAAFFYLCPPNF